MASHRVYPGGVESLMRQFAFMILAALTGTFGSFVWSPVYGIATYYLFAALRPQFMWYWVDLGGYHIDDFDWSKYVAVAALLSTAAWRVGLLAPAKVAAPPWYGDPPYTRSHYLFLAFTAWIGLTYITAVNQERAWPYFVEYIKIFVMFICSTWVLRSLRDLWLIYFIIVVSTIYVAYEINFYYLIDKKMLLQSRGYGGLDNNGASLLLAMAGPMCYFAWESVRHWVRWGFLLVIPILIHAILLSFSRGAMLSLCVGAIVVWLRSRHKRFLTVVYGGLAVLVLIMAGQEVRERFLSINQQQDDESAKSRWTTWRIAIRMANERPLFGYGIRNSNLFTYSYGADMEGRSIHSQYLQTAADSGWVALGLYVGLFGSVFVGLREVRRGLRKWDDPESNRAKSMASGLESALVVFCFGAIFLSLEHVELPYVIMLLAVQLHTITRSVIARHGTGGLLTRAAALPYPDTQPATSAS